MEDVFQDIIRSSVEPPQARCTLSLIGFDGDKWVQDWTERSSNELASDSDALTRKPGRASDYVRGSIGQRPFAPAALTARRKDPVDSALPKNRFRAFMGSIDGDSDALQMVPTFLQEAQYPDLYNLSYQDPALVQNYHRTADQIHEIEVERARGAAEAGQYYILGEDASGVQVSAKQEGFRLDTVFKPGDEQLFGLTEDAGDYEDDDEDDADAATVEDPRAATGTGDELDNTLLELDNLLEEGRAETLRRPKERVLKKGSLEVWAAEDTTDVSNFDEIVSEPVKTYPFDLDPFQKRAIVHIERSENVFVAAHTSAGKTVVAEYAIAMCESHGTKVLYTSPIKTLSNQKFRDFSETFSEVGIVTGDISFRQEAACLVMTTEILRSMLYKGADLIRDVEWVIFDEVHYVNDAERGVVWEEVIIMLPEHVRLVMLSATVPNAMEFAEWVGRSRKSKVFVVSTMKRPVPLEHSLFMKKEKFLILDSTKKFLSRNFNSALRVDKEGKESVKGSHRHSWGVLVQYLKKNEMTPAVIFAFSKKKCEEGADSLRQTDLSTGQTEKAQVHAVFEKALGQLNPADRSLPQIERMREMLKRGVGLHHAGLLPIVKEVVEILFQRGIVRVLFATETFAMGVNMPARTVVFSALRKHDGQQFRFLQPGEYIQMAGRAGRRGLDKVGHVLLYFPPGNIPSELEVTSVLTGRPLELVSQFRLTYNMILNLLRLEELRVEDMIRRSFSEAGAGRDTVKVKKLMEKGEQTLAELRSGMGFLGKFEDYFEAWHEATSLSASTFKMLFEHSASFLGPGRVLVLRRADRGMALAVALQTPKSTSSSAMSATKSITLRSLVLKCASGESAFHTSAKNALRKPKATRGTIGGMEYEICDVGPGDVLSVLSTTLTIDAALLNPPRGGPDPYALSIALEQLQAVAQRLGSNGMDGMADARKHLKVLDVSFVEAWERKEHLLQVLMAHPMASSPRLGEAMDSLDKIRQLEVRLEKLQWAASDESLQLLPDYTQRLEVLHRLNYVSEDNVVQLKGRAACEINTADSLIVTELVFENVLSELGPEECAALLTALVAKERTQEEIQVPEELEAAKESLERIVLGLGVVQGECGMPVAPLEYTRLNLQWSMSMLVLHWARGEKFSAILDYAPDILEGSIVRCVVRLSELLRETRNAAMVIGDSSLYTKMETAMNLIKRDIIFAASLYLA